MIVGNSRSLVIARYCLVTGLLVIAVYKQAKATEREREDVILTVKYELRCTENVAAHQLPASAFLYALTIKLYGSRQSGDVTLYLCDQAFSSVTAVETRYRV